MHTYLQHFMCKCEKTFPSHLIALSYVHHCAAPAQFYFVQSKITHEKDNIMQTEFNMTDAAVLAGVSRRTFYNHIDSKPITTKRNQNDEKVVDLSELKRVYGEETILSNLQKMQEDDDVQPRELAHNDGVQSVQNSQSADLKLMRARIEALENEKNLIEEQARREREQIQDERDFLRKRLEEAQEGQKRITLLLEDHSQKQNGGEAWEKSFRALEQRLANQEKAAKDREEKEQRLLKQNRGLKQALEAEKNKSFWQKLFG